MKKRNRNTGSENTTNDVRDTTNDVPSVTRMIGPAQVLADELAGVTGGGTIVLAHEVGHTIDP